MFTKMARDRNGGDLLFAKADASGAMGKALGKQLGKKKLLFIVWYTITCLGLTNMLAYPLSPKLPTPHLFILRSGCRSSLCIVSKWCEVWCGIHFQASIRSLR